RPFLRLHAHRVRVRHQQNGTLNAVAFETRYQVGALWLLRENLDRNALRFEYFLQILHRGSLVVRRARRIDPHQRGMMTQSLGVHSGPVRFRGGGRNAHYKSKQPSPGHLAQDTTCYSKVLIVDWSVWGGMAAPAAATIVGVGGAALGLRLTEAHKRIRVM